MRTRHRELHHTLQIMGKYEDGEWDCCRRKGETAGYVIMT